MSKQPLVYLCGPISGHYYEGAVGWRDKATAFLKDFGIRTLDPMRGKGELKGLGHPIESAFDQNRVGGKMSPLRTPKAIFRRDRWDVWRCDLMLANFEETAVSTLHPDMQVASIGSVMEIAWADAYMTPVLAVLPTPNIHTHSLLQQCMAWEVETLDEALELVPVILGV